MEEHLEKLGERSTSGSEEELESDAQSKQEEEEGEGATGRDEEEEDDDDSDDDDDQEEEDDSQVNGEGRGGVNSKDSSSSSSSSDSSDSDKSDSEDKNQDEEEDDEDDRKSSSPVGEGEMVSQEEEMAGLNGYQDDGSRDVYPPLPDLPLEVITTVEPTNYAYPVLKNMSNGVLTHRNIFTEYERQVLVSIIDKYRPIVDTRSRTREIYLEKQNVWQQIVEEYNSTENIMVRTEKELRKCWDNMKYRAKQAEKEALKVEVKAEDEGMEAGGMLSDVKLEPLDLNNPYASRFHSDYETGRGDSWPHLEGEEEEEGEPALKRARQESPKLSSLLLAAPHKRPSHHTPKKPSGSKNTSVTLKTSSAGDSFPYSIPSCTKVMHIKKEKQQQAFPLSVSQSPSLNTSEIPILPKGLSSCLSITNIPNPVSVAGQHGVGTLQQLLRGHRGSPPASTDSSHQAASIKPMPSLKKMVPTKQRHQQSKGRASGLSSSQRTNRRSNGINSKSQTRHHNSSFESSNPGGMNGGTSGSHASVSAVPSSPSPVDTEQQGPEGEVQQLSTRLAQQRLEWEQLEHELRMRLMEKELQAHTAQAQYWALRLKLLRGGREGLGALGALGAGATNGDIG